MRMWKFIICIRDGVSDCWVILGSGANHLIIPHCDGKHTRESVKLTASFCYSLVVENCLDLDNICIQHSCI